MSEKYAYIGYDLGDGETITDFAILSDEDIEMGLQTNFVSMTMPDTNDPGKAIPTAYGFDKESGEVVFASSILSDPENIRDICLNFKRRPSDLLGNISDGRCNEILSAFEKETFNSKNFPETDSPEMNRFIDAVVIFTNAIFGDKTYEEKIRGSVVDCKKIVFCIGHPTKWNELDIALYKFILSKSMLGNGSYVGKPTEILMAAESRAAFLYVKDKTRSDVLPKNTCALLIDVGSSTIDLTAMTADSRNHQYNSGSNYLGARSVDYIIREWYLEKLRADEDDWEIYRSLTSRNETMDKALTLSCRKAKEEVFSVSSGKAFIIFADFPPIRINRNDVGTAIENYYIGNILKNHIGIPEKEAEVMKNKTWKTLFHEFLVEKKAEINAMGLNIGRIIMTGSASKMPIVPDTVKEVFSDIEDSGILPDMNPSRSISMGLALVGPSNNKSKSFQNDIIELMKNDIPSCIADDLPVLVDALADVIDGVINNMVKTRFSQWKSGNIKTLNDMMELIKRDCSESSLNTILSQNEDYNNVINNWTVNIVGQDIAKRLQAICKRYGVNDFTLDQLNIMKVPEVSLKEFSINPTEDIMAGVVAVLSIIAGIIAMAVLPTVLGIVIGLISWISVSLAVVLMEILLAIPGVGLTVLIGIVGIAVVKAASKGLGSAKAIITDKLQSVDLPQWVRSRMKDETIDEKLREANVKGKIKEGILQEDSKKQIISSVTESLKKQVSKRAEDIKYVIESK